MARSTVVAAALLLACGLVGVQGQNQLSQEATAACVFNAVDSANLVMEACLFSDSITGTCDKNGGLFDQIGCAVDVNGIVGAFLGIGSLISSMVVNCRVVVNEEAQCAADILALIKTISGLAQVGASFVSTCHALDLASKGKRTAGKQGRRLREVSAAEAMAEQGQHHMVARALEEVGFKPQERSPGPVKDPVGIAWCVVDVLEMATGFGNVGLGIKSATDSCQGANKDTLSCAGTATGITATLIDIGKLMAAASGDCSSGVHTESYCAADVQQLVAELANVAAFGINYVNGCQINPGQAINRRLQPGQRPAQNMTEVDAVLKGLKDATALYNSELAKAKDRKKAFFARKLAANGTQPLLV